jgi:DNA-binding MarR family transcriptional regulator
MSKTFQLQDRSRLRNLAEFRYQLRRFLQFSEGCAAEAGLHPQQHQLLLQLAGAPGDVETTVSYAAERLGLRHHTVVELSKRCEEAGLIHRNQDLDDRRRIQLQVTAKGHRVLRTLSEDHAQELYDLAPTLIGALSLICGPDDKTRGNRRSTVTAQGDCK